MPGPQRSLSSFLYWLHPWPGCKMAPAVPIITPRHDSVQWKKRGTSSFLQLFSGSMNIFARHPPSRLPLLSYYLELGDMPALFTPFPLDGYSKSLGIYMPDSWTPGFLGSPGIFTECSWHLGIFITLLDIFFLFYW